MIASRRTFLKMTAAAGATLTAPHSLFAADLQTSTPVSRLQPMPLGTVRLAPGIFAAQAEINARYLDSLKVDRLLHSFRLTAGINSTATPYGGWEEPRCELRGHFNGGHYLSAVALASAHSGNDDLKARGNQLVGGLAQCQKKLGNGYLSAYPTELFDRLSQGREVWAPFYTYHKILAGLIDMYQLTGNTEALEVAEGMARWTGDYFNGIGLDQRQRMLRTEYGGMNESLVNLADITKKEHYLAIARLFEQPSILDPLAARRDELQGLHANTNVPKIIGAARTYEVTGSLRHRQIAEYFLEEVLTARSYAIGNTSLDEHWTTPANQLKDSLGWSNAECCVAYNLMKLERLVYSWSADPRWMDAYERQLFNCRLGTQNSQGLKQYFFPLAAGYWRAYGSPEDSFWCCTGTGAEEFAKFSDTIYFHRGADLYVNHFLASTLDWKDQSFRLEQKTSFPEEQGTTIRITASGSEPRTIHIRIPSWVAATPGASVQINGKSLEATADPGSYLAIRRTWRAGDVITLSLPMHLRTEPLAGDPSIYAALYGPMVLAAHLGSGPTDGPTKIIHGRPTMPEKLDKPAPLPAAPATASNLAPGWITEKSGLQFEAKNGSETHPLLPLYQIKDQRYSIYWNSGQ
jgi:DUF1680 family protein